MTVRIDHTCVALGYVFPRLRISSRCNNVQETAQIKPFTGFGVITENEEVIATVRAGAGKTDIDASLVIHPHCVPALLQGYISGSDIFESNLVPINARCILCALLAQ